MEQQTDSNRVLTAARLGWLTVEAFGRLRQYTRSGRKPKEHQGDATRRFDFSDRTLSKHDALLLATDQLRHTTGKLNLKISELPFPSHDELDRSPGEIDLDALQGALDDWSTQVWVALSTEDEVGGRSFTYGGSLADTYWHAEVLGTERFANLLRAPRLEYIAARFEGIADHLPPYTAPVLHHTLYKWRVQEQIEKLDPASKKQVLKRLESQAKVWHDLLFGSRNAESYLTAGDRRLVTWGAALVTAVLVLAAMVLVWLVVLALSSTGRVVAASMTGLPQQLAAAQEKILIDMLDWGKWTTLLATFSSVAVLLTGIVTRLSGWMISFHNLVREWLKLGLIYRRTDRRWRT